jgi:dolichyl-phosphate beta-glucosyltransferase
MVHLSVIIPAHNEKRRLPKTLQDVSLYLSRQDYDYEIIVVDGGSTDGTPEICRQKAREIKNLSLIELDGLGKGHAVKQGMLQAQGKYQLFMDADNSTSLDQVEKMWPEFEQGYDVVIGSRDIKGAVLAVSQPWQRRALGRIFNLIVQTISGLRGIPDTQCGFKGFTERAAKDIFSRLTIFGWAFDVEVLVLAKRMGYKCKEVPVRWVNDPESKVKLGGMIKMLFEVLKIRWNIISGRYA